MVNGKSFNSHSNRSHNATAKSIATIVSLHWPKSIKRGTPSISPKSRSLNLNLPQAKVKTIAKSNKKIKSFQQILCSNLI